MNLNLSIANNSFKTFFKKNISKNQAQNNNQTSNVTFKGYLDRDIVEIQGKETKAKVFTTNLDYQTYDQIKTICSHPVFKDLPVRIMPDTHAGKNVPVGFTAPIGAQGEIIPSLISGDIGCGMLCCEINPRSEEIDFEKLDDIIRTYLSARREEVPAALKKMAGIETLSDKMAKKKYKAGSKYQSGLGTLGGGNHFIELDKTDDGKYFLVIHTGSRHFGEKVYNYHNEIAGQQNPYKIKDLSYLTGDEAKEYLEDMKIAQEFATANRRIIADEIIQKMGWKEEKSFETAHNYISDDGIIRKGAIEASKDKQIIIPLNMRDGSIIATGKGNIDWNNSAPHGAGRQFSRKEADELITIEDFRSAMEGIYSSNIRQSCVDESPDAYKPADEIIRNIHDTADIETIIRPIYNYKD